MCMQHKLLKMRTCNIYPKAARLFTLETWLPRLANALGGSQLVEASLQQPETADVNPLLDSAKFKIQKSCKSK